MRPSRAATEPQVRKHRSSVSLSRGSQATVCRAGSRWSHPDQNGADRIHVHLNGMDSTLGADRSRRARNDRGRNWKTPWQTSPAAVGRCQSGGRLATTGPFPSLGTVPPETVHGRAACRRTCRSRRPASLARAVR